MDGCGVYENIWAGIRNPEVLAFSASNGYGIIGDFAIYRVVLELIGCCMLLLNISQVKRLREVWDWIQESRFEPNFLGSFRKR